MLDFDEYSPVTIADFAAAATDGGVRLEWSLDSDEPIDPIPLDRDQFKRAIHNLIKNAIEASSPGDPIDVTVKKVKDKIRIQIIDHGRGMDRETKEKATAPYFTTKRDGSGIGLFLVKRIIKDHGGEFDIKSEVDRGTCITIIM